MSTVKQHNAYLLRHCGKVKAENKALKDAVLKYLNAVEAESGQATTLRELSLLVGYVSPADVEDRE